MNRTLISCKRQKNNNTGIIVIDLNNLKIFNDTFGHDMGDQYIQTASAIFSEIFQSAGTIYRIGGDEFCIITKGINENVFLKLQEIMEKELSTQPGPADKYQMSAASGFALFDSNLDGSLRDTLKRADEVMYKRKLEIKRKMQ